VEEGRGGNGEGEWGMNKKGGGGLGKGESRENGGECWEGDEVIFNFQ
jgi:hypothetical protein